MSIETRRHQYGTVFGHWRIKESLGQGSGGKSAVFRLEHAESSTVESALKVVSLLEETGSFQELSPQRRADYERSCLEYSQWANQEVLLMNELQGNTYIVDYLDHTFVDWSDETGFGRDMLIRMERLTDIRGKLRKGVIFSRSEIIKLGIHICNALILCHGKNILHRDIKPGNIFINKNGDYKLGDFGISKIMDSSATYMASTGIGTPQYWAPEQISGQYDKRVDIYSLGLVLYELSNANRLPFASSCYVRESEVQRRMMGETLPAPCNADADLAAVILKACAYRPGDRYPSAEAFREALAVLEFNQPMEEQTLAAGWDAMTQRSTAGHGYTTPAMPYSTPQTPVQQGYVPAAQQVYATPVQQSYGTPAPNGQWGYGAAPASQSAPAPVKEEKKKGMGWLFAVLALVLALLIGVGAWLLLRDDDGGSSRNDRNHSSSRDEDEDDDDRAEHNTAPAATEGTSSGKIDWSQGKDEIPRPTEDTTPPETTAPPAEVTPTEPATEAPDPAAELKAALAGAEVGDIITFGRYEQDNYLNNGQEAIAWLVLDKQDGRLMLMSVYALDCKPYNTTDTSVTWATCTLRTWLNKDFYVTAFTELERQLIPQVPVTAEANPYYNNDPGADTYDYVYLLSADEHLRYLSGSDRLCYSTAYAKTRGSCWVDANRGTSWWWLRGVGEFYNQAVNVNTDGSIDYQKGTVNSPYAVVRPVIWVAYE